jgi:hypothetical protein
MMTAARSHCSVPLSAACLWLAAFPLGAHDFTGHSGPTCEITAPIQLADKAARLRLTILDQQTGTHTPARFSVVLNLGGCTWSFPWS